MSLFGVKRHIHQETFHLSIARTSGPVLKMHTQIHTIETMFISKISRPDKIIKSNQEV